jgi:DNA repair exonuclease SbcCD nuclease subunit
MSKSFLAFADLHLGLTPFNKPELAQDLKTTFTDICSLAISLKVDYLINCGDEFDTNKPTPELISFVKDGVRLLKNNGVTPIGLAGDHSKPINGKCWLRDASEFLAFSEDATPNLFGLDYSDVKDYIPDGLKACAYASKVEWLFFHGQFLSIFPFCEEKKKIDFSTFPVFEVFPKLKGIILGDIHKPLQGTLKNCTKEIPVMYCGSPGVINSGEIGDAKSVIHFDGKTLKRIPLTLKRGYHIVDLTSLDFKEHEIGYLYSRYEKAKGAMPVVVVKYNRSTQDKLKLLTSLYRVAHVRLAQVSANVKHAKVECSIRSEINNTDRVYEALKLSCEQPDIVDLLYSLINTEDSKLVLDKFVKAQLC